MATATQNVLLEGLPKDRPALVYDGDCGFCNGSVKFVLAHEKRRDLVFVPRASELGMAIA
jgi:predicted DCC family thiol-disulfide oxidoreductase YuxK